MWIYYPILKLLKLHMGSAETIQLDTAKYYVGYFLLGIYRLQISASSVRSFVSHVTILPAVIDVWRCYNDREKVVGFQKPQRLRYTGLSSEFAICHVVQHGNVSGRRIQ